MHMERHEEMYSEAASSAEVMNRMVASGGLGVGDTMLGFPKDFLEENPDSPSSVLLLTLVFHTVDGAEHQFLIWPNEEMALHIGLIERIEREDHDGT